MKQFNSAFLLLTFIIFSGNVFSQNANAKTLLWRISGKGLTKPSYLFGTMHLYDKRIFNFGDSVYKSIENTDGFAMELDPNSMMDTILSKINEEDTTSLIEQLINKKQFDSVEKKLEKKMGVPANRITRKMLVDERNKEIYKRRHKDDMNTVVDLYLYNIAKQEGKKVGGVEDVNDQLGLVDELGKDFNINDFLDDNSAKTTDYINHMIDLYVSEDINKIDQWINEAESAGTKDLVLIKRNRKMARRMDSLSELRSTFFAVGAAHLPGDSGVISLLRKRGLSVTPVFSSVKIAPKNYKYTVKEFPWTKVVGQDSLYTVDMPGKPTDVNKLANELKMKMYGDLITNTFYITGLVETDSSNNKEETIEKIMKNFSIEKIDKQSRKDIANNGIAGVELNGTKDDVYFRVQVFLTGDKEYMAIVGSLNQEDLAAKDATRFLQSFVMNKDIEIRRPDWIIKTDSTKAFSISFPKAAEIYKLPANKTPKNWTSTVYSSLDLKANTYYMLVVNEINKGFIMYADSSYFKERINIFKNNPDVTSTKQSEIFNYHGYPAMTITAYSNKDSEELVTYMLSVLAGNRNYNIIAVSDKKNEEAEAIKKFKNSFKLLPAKIGDWKRRTVDNHSFTTWTPSGIELNITDTAGLSDYEKDEAIKNKKKNFQYLMFDKYASITYNITENPISPYYWTGNDSSFYNDETSTFYTSDNVKKLYKSTVKTDSLIYSKNVLNGKFDGREILVKVAGNGFYKKIRVIRNGDSVYHLYTFLRGDALESENNKRFFDDFTINETKKAGHLFENKTEKIIKDLSTTDSATFSDALNGLREAHFTKEDIPLLLPALLKNYPLDSLEQSNTNALLCNSIQPFLNDSIVDFISKNYLSAANGDVKQSLLELLAENHTAYSYNALGSVLAKSPMPATNNYKLGSLLKDSLKLCATLFPAIESLYNDSIGGPLIINLSVKLIDSSLLDKKSATDHAADIYEIANKQIAGYRNDSLDYYGPFNESIIRMLSVLNTEKSADLLNQFLRLDNMYVKQNAAIALLKNNNKVQPAQIEKIAADRTSRIEFYNRLEKIGKQNIFPAKWQTQKSFAESYLYNYINEDGDLDDESLTLQYVSDKIEKKNGKQYRYFLFKATIDNGDSKETHLAICGPFDFDKSKVLINGDDEKEEIFYDEPYNPASIDKLFKTYLEDSAGN